jgi:hypothetical protein
MWKFMVAVIIEVHAAHAGMWLPRSTDHNFSSDWDSGMAHAVRQATTNVSLRLSYRIKQAVCRYPFNRQVAPR